jgi:hypothetical protein
VEFVWRCNGDVDPEKKVTGKDNPSCVEEFRCVHGFFLPERCG